MLVQDPENRAGLKPEFYPTEALVTRPSVDFRASEGIRRIAVLNPANSPHNTAAMLLHTNLSRNIALGFGFRTLQNGLLDVQHPWKAILPICKDCMLDDVHFESEEVQTIEKKDLSSITIEGVKIGIDISQQSWWARTSRNIIVSIVGMDTTQEALHKSTFADSKEGQTAIESLEHTSFGSTDNETKEEMTTRSMFRKLARASSDHPSIVVGIDYGTTYSGTLKLCLKFSVIL
jgi:hypothetical protein